MVLDLMVVGKRRRVASWFELISQIVVLVAVVSLQNLVPSSSHLHCDAFTASSPSTSKRHLSNIFNHIQQNRRHIEHRKRIEVTVSSTARYTTTEDSQPQLTPVTPTKDHTTIDGIDEELERELESLSSEECQPVIKTF